MNDDELSQPLNAKRKYYLHMMAGGASVAGFTLTDGDALTIENESALHVLAKGDTRFLLFDLP